MRISSQPSSKSPLILTGIFTALAFAIATSCSDDIAYTTDPSANISLKQDTLRFDTMFTGITSVTKRFCVYNTNNKHVRIKSVRLESGGTSGFMINVDGQSGTEIHDISVGDKDSVFVFVKAKLEAKRELEPRLSADNVIFTMENGNTCNMRLEASGQDCQTCEAKTLDADMTITASDLPIVVYDSLVVPQGKTLTIEPGSTIYFHNSASLIVRGGLVAKGTAEKPVTLRGDRLDRMFTYLPYDRLNNQWGGVRVEPTCEKLAIDHADIHSSTIGISCRNVAGPLTITNSVIHNIASDALYLEDCHATVANCQLSNAKGDCLHITGGATNVYHCTMAQFYPWSADRGHALTMHTTIDEAAPPIIEANFYNCFITGYDKDEVFCYKGEKEEVNLNFYNCVALTDVKDEKYFHSCTADSKEEERYQATNFKTFDTHAYIYDLRLDSLSTARGKGNAEYAKEYPADRYGTARSNTPDAGCYQYVEPQKP